LSDIDAIIERVSGSPVAMAKVARNLLLQNGHAGRARALCDRAMAMAPDDGEVRALRDEVFSTGVGAWFFNMVWDQPRHIAMARALDNALSSGGRVLDIGTGTGLFAMMAARAGADEVITCERDPAVAEAARAVIKANGLGERIDVIEKASSDMVLGVDMSGLADLLTWDNVGSDLVSLGTLPEIEDAMRRLVRPGGSAIPARCVVKAALAEDVGWRRRRMGNAQGFDLSPFNRLARPVYMITSDRPGLEVRSTAAELFAFDFSGGGPFPAEKAVRQVEGRGGAANGVVQWLEFAMSDDQVYQTGPGAESCAFGLMFHPTQEPFEAARDEAFGIGASHDRTGIWIWLERG
jgi:protein-L-isoaspartate O-methyltransferase